MDKSKDYKQEAHHSTPVNEASKEKLTSDDTEKEASGNTSPSQDHDSDMDGSLSISHNIRKLIRGKIDHCPN